MICFFQHYHKPGWDLFTEQHTTHILDVHKNTTFWKGGNAIVFSTPPPFLASQDALEVMRVTELLDVLIDFPDVTLVSDDTYRRLYWCDPDYPDGPNDPDKSFLVMKVI